VKLQLALLIIGLMAWGPASADASDGSSGLPAPAGLMPCASASPAAGLAARLAAQLGGDFLGCFQSERTGPATQNSASNPDEYAFAIALPGGGYTEADLDKLLSGVKAQWKGFDPLSKAFKETYTARLNGLLRRNGSPPSSSLVSVKPVLVSIDQPNDDYYLVTSIRTYVVDLGGERVAATKVTSDAVALRNAQLVRLTIQRTLSDPADVAQVQGEIADWARATAQGSSTGP
jgi:hypothetical protein